MTDKKSLGDYILLDPLEVPSIQELEQAAEILKRCEVIFGRIRKKNDPPAKSMEHVASFLETFVASNRNKLKRSVDEKTE